MKHNLTLIITTLVIAGFLGGCASTTVKSTQHNPIIQSTEVIPEDELLDIGVGIFNPGVDQYSAEEEGVFLQVREAEARFFPVKLVETLQHTGNWGVVRVVPERQSEMDVWVDGEILESDGEILAVRITVQDSSGKTWYTRDYDSVTSKYAYDNSLRSQNEEPFQGLYNDIANDLVLYRQRLEPAEIANIRTITELKFARQFSPEAFGDHIEEDRRGIYKVKRLPAENDPTLTRIRKIRQRDNMYVDTLQDYYMSFEQQMDRPYREWRKMSYEETLALRQLRNEANARLLGGALAVIGGIVAQGSDSPVTRTAGMVGIGAGAYTVKEGLDRRSEAKIHVQAIEELGTSLNAELEPRTIELENSTVTLTGTVNEQYDQWRAILKDIYLTETGEAGQVLAN
ncbi:MAG: hypothetical protein WD709_01415 [Gammaproteobacteria bacterium]